MYHTTSDVVTDVGSNLATDYDYDTIGNVSTITVSQGVTTIRSTTHTYDPLRHWLTKIEHKDGSGVNLSTFDYVRRADGQILQVDETVKQPDNTFVVTQQNYTYDALNRLTKEVVDTVGAVNDFSNEYGLDLVGNRTQKIHIQDGVTTKTNYTYSARDQLLNETDGSSTINYGYDSNGSLTTQSGGGSTRTQSWDIRGRLEGATVDGVITKYEYTPDGIRSSVTEGSSTVDYIIDEMTPSGYAQVVEELESGLSVVRYTYGSSLDPISENRGGTDAAYLGDGHSGVRQAVDVSGAMLLVQRFDAYGQTVAKAGTLQTPIGYRGERFDSTLGQYSLRARYYDPASGRFTGVDPYAGTYSDTSQSMRYGYAGGNPVWGMDPSGMISLGGIGNFLGVSGLLTAISFGGGSIYGTVTGREAGFWEGFIPGWGSGRSYGATASRGSPWAFLHLGMGLTEIVGIGYLAKFVPPSVKSWFAAKFARLASTNLATGTGKLFANARGQIQDWVIPAGRQAEVSRWITALQREYTRITGHVPQVNPNPSPIKGSSGHYDVGTRLITLFDNEAAGGVATGGSQYSIYWTKGADGVITPPVNGVSASRLEELFHWLQCHNLGITHASQITPQVRTALENDVGDFLIFVGCAPIK